MQQIGVMGSALFLFAFLGTPSHGANDAPERQAAKPMADLPAPASLAVTPSAVSLRGVDNVQRLLVTGPAQANGSIFDYSRKAAYASSDAQVATVTADGVVEPRGNGKAEVRVTFAGKSAVTQVSVTDFGAEVPVSFRNQIVPIFTKHGCNAGGCHGKASGQNGFRLSLFGFDAAFDFSAVTKEARGRRVFPAAPEQSLILQKASGGAPHGGGNRLPVGSGEYGILLRWLRQGTPAGSTNDPHVVRIACFPKSCVSNHNVGQQVLVTASYSDGTTRDVTREAQFKSSEENIAAVDGDGVVRTFESSGSTAVMARYMVQVDVCQ